MNDSDLQAIVEQVSGEMLARLAATHPTQEDYQENGNILTQFNGIAVGMLKNEAGIEIPGSGTPIPWDENMIRQALSLFCEGLYYALARCRDTSISGELKLNLLQSLAMEIYGQSKQVVIATLGQEQTPEFQFSAEQQAEIIRKATEGYLMSYIAEYERANGPIQPMQPVAPASDPELSSNSSVAMEGQPLAAPEGEIPSAPGLEQPVQQTVSPPSGTNHEKYGAVALLIGTLPESQHSRILRRFNAQEQEVIAFYRDPAHIEQHLDIVRVEAHLKRFHEMLKKSTPEKAGVHAGIRRLLETYSLEKLLSCVKEERPKVARHLRALHERIVAPSAPPRKTSLLSGMSEAPALTALPPRVEEVLYQYLVRRLEPV